MKFFDWDAELSDADRDRLIEGLVRKVKRYGLETTAIFFLEMHKPLNYVASQTLLFGSGFLAPLFGPENVQQYSKLLEKRENVELLIRRIEDLQVLPETDAEPKTIQTS